MHDHESRTGPAGSVSDGVDRRRFLKISAAAGMPGAAVVLDPVVFSAPAVSRPPGWTHCRACPVWRGARTAHPPMVMCGHTFRRM
jgi:anaerobic selenocysteine-containing dehydrogenase